MSECSWCAFTSTDPVTPKDCTWGGLAPNIVATCAYFPLQRVDCLARKNLGQSLCRSKMTRDVLEWYTVQLRVTPS